MSKRNRTLTILLKAGAAIVAFCAVVLISVTILLNSSSVQNRLLSQATKLLTEQLQTHVRIDSINFSLFKQEFKLRNVEIEDQQQRKMFQMQALDVHLSFLPLLRHEVNISTARVRGLSAELYKQPGDSAANYQFFIDAFKKKPQQQEDSTQSKQKVPMTWNIKKVTIEDVKARYNDNDLALQSIRYYEDWHGNQQVRLQQLQGTWKQTTKRGEQQNHAAIGVMEAEKTGQHITVSLNDLHFTTDNHQPRKNQLKPKRGFFDPGHLDITAHLKFEVSHISKDSVVATLTRGEICDSVTGIFITNLTTRVMATPQTLHFADVHVALPNTTLSFDDGELQLPSKKEGRPLAYSTSMVKGNTLLKDISRPFAPVLKDFTLPVLFQARLRGTEDEMSFSDIFVRTPDNRLTIKAKGGLKALKDKYKMRVHFDVSDMHARRNVAQDIINQFPIKKFMMKQLRTLGHIRYNGSIDVHWKQEDFRGLLRTDVGDLNFQFSINDLHKYLTGSINTQNVELGKAMEMDKIGKVACQAQFKFDISKQRTAIMRKRKGGKLPIGNLKAKVNEASYMKVKVRNIDAEIESDGAEATGKLVINGRHTDGLFSFIFNNTDEMRKIRIKPGIRFHGLSDEAKAEKEKKKAEKEANKLKRQQEKAARKLEKQREKEARKLEKQKAKEAKDSGKPKKKFLW